MESEVRSELALDLRPPSSSAAVKCVARFLREAAMAGEGRVAKLEEYVRGLEEEHRKIEGFRRELPLCMLILSDVIEGLKEELTKCRGGEVITGGGGGPLLEEFMPMKRKSDDEEGMKQEKDFQDKVNWMSSAQLWSDNYSANTSSTTSNTVVTNNNDASSSSNNRGNTRERAEDDRSVRGDENPLTESQYRKAGGAFLTFKGLSSFPASGSRKEEKVTAAVVPPLPDLSLLSPSTKTTRGVSSVTEDQRSGKSGSRGSSRGLPPSAVNSQTSLQLQESLSQQASRKPRRCWSPELHRRFVKALQQLGGSQAATPKQIRELMKVDGLTNDEVKSHLQKYRLHTRRMPTPSAPANQQVVVLGGLWVSPENNPVSKQSTSQSGSPQGPLHLANASRGMSATGVDREPMAKMRLTEFASDTTIETAVLYADIGVEGEEEEEEEESALIS